MFCSVCGNKMPDTAKFCTVCGSPLAKKPVPADVIEPVTEEVTEAAAEVAAPVIEEVHSASEAVAKAAEAVTETAAEELAQVIEAEPVAEAAPPVVETAQPAAEAVKPMVEAAQPAAEAVNTAEEPKTADLRPGIPPEDKEAKSALNGTKEALGSILSSTAGAVKGMNSGSLGTAAMLLASISLICMFISLTRFSILSRILHIIAVGILVFLTIRKEKYPSVLYAVPLGVVTLSNIITTGTLIIQSITSKYIVYRPGALNTIYKLVLIAAFVLLLLMGVRAIKKRKSANIAVIVCTGLLALNHLINVFSLFRAGRATLFINLAMLLFYAAYIIIALMYQNSAAEDEDDTAYSRAYASSGAGYTYAGTRSTGSSAAANSAPLFGPESTASRGSAPLFTDTPAAPAADAKAQKPAAPDPEFIFCVSCGAKLPADSAFCNKCGTPVIK